MCADPCSHGDIQLIGGGDEFEGQVEVCFRGVWGAVCDHPGGWDTSDAIVSCRQLGYIGGTEGTVSC